MDLPVKNTPSKNSLCLQQKTKSEGKVDLVLGMFLLLMIVLVVMYESRLQAIRLAGDAVEDALAGALLAAAVTDVETYGKTGELKINNVMQSYHMCVDTFRHNLQLSVGNYSINEELLYGKAELADFRIYHVEGDDVTEQIVVAGQSMLPKVVGRVGDAKTPDGVLVESTLVYGKVLFSVKGLFFEEICADKEMSVDIVRNEEIVNEKE